MGDDEARIIRPPNTLKAKLGSGAGTSLDIILADAEKALESMENQYKEWLADYIASLETALATAQGTTPPDPEAITRIRKTAHEIKGQGATFGYPLLSEAGYLLFRLTDQPSEQAAQWLELIAAFINFMGLIVREDIRGNGGKKESQLLAALEAATKKALDG